MTRRLGRGRGGPGLLSSMARTAVLAGSHLRAPILQAITAVGGAGLVIRGVVDAGPALLGFLPSPVTRLESVVALAALLAPGWAGITTQRQQAPACLP